MEARLDLTRGRRPLERLLPWALLGSFAVFYIATWSGRYFHDGPLFIDRLAGGNLLWFHAGYLPTGWLIQKLLEPVHEISSEQALAILSVLSALSMVGLTHVLAGCVSPDPWLRSTCAVLVGLAPTVWFGSGCVEIHIFSGATSFLAAFLATRTGWHPALRAPLACLIALTGHMTALLLCPFLIALVAVSQRRSGGPLSRSSILGLTASSGVAILLYRLAVRALPLGQADSFLFARRAWNAAVQALTSFDGLASRLGSEIFSPWLLLSVAPLACLWELRDPRNRVLAGLCGCAGLSLLGLCSLYQIDVPGQISLIAAPFLALSMALVLARLPRRDIVLPGALIAQLVLAIPRHAELTRDLEREWAQKVANSVERPCVIATGDTLRHKHLSVMLGKEAVVFFGRQDQVREARLLLSKGYALYLDASTLRKSLAVSAAPGERRRLATGRVIQAYLEAFQLEPVPDVDLMRVVSVLR